MPIREDRQFYDLPFVLLFFSNFIMENNITNHHAQTQKENEFDEYEYETAKQIFANEEAFRQYAMEKETQFVYQLPNNNMVVVVC